MLILVVAGSLIVIAMCVAINKIIALLPLRDNGAANIVCGSISQAERQAMLQAEFEGVCREFREQQTELARWLW